VSKKVIFSGVCVALMLSAVGLNVWYTRYRVPEAVSLEVEHPSKPLLHQAQGTNLPAQPRLPYVDINSVRRQRQLAREEAAALRRVSRSRRNVTRTFIVDWEMHHGFFFVSLNSTGAQNRLLDDWITPNFRDHALADKFARFARHPELIDSTGAVHLGHRLICHCTGVPWRFYMGKRFLVRSATLEWQ
jgi:hypothetical protein